ncbi:MAG: type II secretion system GspH family protein [Fusobacterium sp.]|nr:type II secretion system GspH family protein [Fusobacterium sp.]
MLHNTNRKDKKHEQEKCIKLCRGGGSSSSGKSVTSSPQSSYGTGSAGGFTMAEILLSLTIIGVVAAITLPSLTGNINERTWNTQRKALYARFSQAIALMPSLNGYGTYTLGDSSTSAVDTAAETFVTAGLSKVLKINNICSSDNLKDCGIPEKVTNMQGSTKSFPQAWGDLNTTLIGGSTGNGYNGRSLDNTKAAAFETANGESIAVYYNPKCTADLKAASDFVQHVICANFVYDLNGSKGPNTVGKDIGFMSAFYSTDPSVVAPMPSVRNSTGPMLKDEASRYCKSLDDEYRLPNRDELGSMFANQWLMGYESTYHHWTSDISTSAGSVRGRLQHFSTGMRSGEGENGMHNGYVRCVKR